MTDLAHIAQLLHETAHRERYGLPALRDGCDASANNRTRVAEHSRRLDSDAAAVQIMTVFVAKGLQFPIVYLPFAFNRTSAATTFCCITMTRHSLSVHRRQRP